QFRIGLLSKKATSVLRRTFSFTKLQISRKIATGIMAYRKNGRAQSKPSNMAGSNQRQENQPAKLSGICSIAGVFFYSVVAAVGKMMQQVKSRKRIGNFIGKNVAVNGAVEQFKRR